MPNVSGPVRARDLRTNILELGFEKGMVYTIEQLLDEFAGVRQTMREAVDLLSQCVDAIGKINHINDGMAKQIDAIKRIGDQDGDAGV